MSIVSKSALKSSESSLVPCAVKLAESSVESNSPLSWFDYPLNQKNVMQVVSTLGDFTEPIIAIWIVARPVRREANGGFMHWCVKVQSQSSLISIDFLESRGKGAFAVRERSNLPSEWDDFMKYELTDPKTGQKFPSDRWPKWEIIACVTPHALSKTRGSHKYNKEYLSRAKYEALKRDTRIMEALDKKKRDYSKFPGKIQTERRICDIATFCKLFTMDNKGYHMIYKNCQQFAAELFAYMLPGDTYKKEKAKVFELYQSPHDQIQWRRKKDRRHRKKKQCCKPSDGKVMASSALKHSLRQPSEPAVYPRDSLCDSPVSAESPSPKVLK